ncbi:hypothetical protein D9M69_652150 [compost metagenome]
MAACTGQQAQAPVARALLRRVQQAFVGGFGRLSLASLAQRVGAHAGGVGRNAPALLQGVDVCQRREPQALVLHLADDLEVGRLGVDIGAAFRFVGSLEGLPLLGVFARRVVVLRGNTAGNCQSQSHCHG